jgi:hypothetical protein
MTDRERISLEVVLGNVPATPDTPEQAAYRERRRAEIRAALVGPRTREID